MKEKSDELSIINVQLVVLQVYMFYDYVHSIRYSLHSVIYQSLFLYIIWISANMLARDRCAVKWTALTTFASCESTEGWYISRYLVKNLYITIFFQICTSVSGREHFFIFALSLHILMIAISSWLRCSCELCEYEFW